jgi:hypothetical protein
VDHNSKTQPQCLPFRTQLYSGFGKKYQDASSSVLLVFMSDNVPRVANRFSSIDLAPPLIKILWDHGFQVTGKLRNKINESLLKQGASFALRSKAVRLQICRLHFPPDEHFDCSAFPLRTSACPDLVSLRTCRRMRLLDGSWLRDLSEQRALNRLPHAKMEQEFGRRWKDDDPLDNSTRQYTRAQGNQASTGLR